MATAAAPARQHALEALVGLGVVVVAALFLFFGLARTGGVGSDGYPLKARFPNSSGVSVGSDVRVSGLKVGVVTGQELDPATYQAILTLSVRHGLKLPADTAAAITSEGILGGSYIALLPGGDSDQLKPGDEITDTQGATDLMGLIGSVINRSGDGAAPAAG